MTVKDWLYFAMTVLGYLIAVIAGIYTKNKDRINRTTSAGKAMDILGQLATNAVHEVEYLGLDNPEKRDTAVQIVQQGLSYMGVKSITTNVINGAVEKAVNAMHLANDNGESGVSDNVDASEVYQPVDQLKVDDTEKDKQPVVAMPVDMGQGDSNGK